MKKVIFALVAVFALVMAVSCDSSDTAQETELYENAVEKGTPPPPNG